MNVLIINAHQLYEGLSTGSLNSYLVDIMKQELLKKGAEIKETKIEEGYNIDVEIEKHEWADLIIVQGPVYWFSFPWIYKRYADEVFSRAIAKSVLVMDDGRTRSDITKQYGSGGKMQGKKVMLSVTFNAPEEAFGSSEQKLFGSHSVDDLFFHTASIYRFCGAEVLPGFSCHDVIKNFNHDKIIGDLKAHLAKYI